MRGKVVGGLGVALALAAATAVAKKDWMEPCPSGADRTHLYELAIAMGDESGAIQRARDKAETELIRKHCGDPCDPLMRVAITSKLRHETSWSAYRRPQRGEEEGTACASYAIVRDVEDSLPRQVAASRRQLDALTDRIQAAVGEAPVAFTAPRWSSACGTGELGAAILGQITSRLTGITTVPLANAVRGEQGARLLQLELAPGVSVTPSLFDLGTGSREGVQGMTFPPALFGLEADWQGSCRGELVEGLQQGLRVGRDGLVVAVDSGVADGVAQHGQPHAGQILTNQPARVWLFSVHSDGRGYLVWPREGGSGELDGQLEIPMRAVHVPALGDELLVAVALLADSHWSEAASWRGTCRIPGRFDELEIPASAAVGSTTFTVVPPAPGAVLRPTGEDVLRKLEEYDKRPCFERSASEPVE